MADTTVMKEVEKFVRDWLANQFPGRTFTSKRLTIGQKRNGGKATHEFDAVSEDNSIVCAIKGSSGKTSGGENPSGKVSSLYHELYFLALADVRYKLLVLTDPEFYDIAVSKTDGTLMKDMEIRLCRIPEQLAQDVTRMRHAASAEMSR